jgi:hypothetical protein
MVTGTRLLLQLAREACGACLSLGSSDSRSDCGCIGGKSKRRQPAMPALTRPCSRAPRPTGAERLRQQHILRSQFETGLQFQSVNTAWGGSVSSKGQVSARGHCVWAPVTCQNKRPPNLNVKMFTTGQWRYQSQRKTGQLLKVKIAYFSKF